MYENVCRQESGVTEDKLLSSPAKYKYKNKKMRLMCVIIIWFVSGFPPLSLSLPLCLSVCLSICLFVCLMSSVSVSLS